MADLYKEAGITPQSLATMETPTEAAAVPAFAPQASLENILKTVGLAGLQQLANIPYGLQRLGKAARIVPPGAAEQQLQQVAPTPGQMPRFTFAEPLAKQYPTAATVGGMLAALAPIPGARLARVGEVAARAASPLARVAARTAQLGGMGALYGGIYGAEQPGVSPTDAAAIGALTGIGAGHLVAAVPHLFIKGIPATSAIEPHIAHELDSIVTHYRGEPTPPENINNEVYNRVAQNYRDSEKALSDKYNNLDTYLGKVSPISREKLEYKPPLGLSVAPFEYAPGQFWEKGVEKPFPEAEIQREPIEITPITKFDRTAYDNAIKKVLNKVNKGLEPYTDVDEIPSKLPAAERDIIKKQFTTFYPELKVDSFSNINTIKKDLNKIIYDPLVSADQKKAAIQLRLGAEQSVEDTAKNSTNPNLREDWKKIDALYKEQIIPFRKALNGKKDSDFYKRFKGGGEDTDKFIESNIKGNEPALSNRFLQMLPDDETRRLAMGQYFAGTEKDPAAFMRKYIKLNPEQRSSLMPEHNTRLDYLANLYKIHPKLFKPTQPVARRLGAGIFRYLPWMMGSYGAAQMGAPEAAIGLAVEPAITGLMGHILPESERFREWYMHGLTGLQQPGIRQPLGRLAGRAIIGGLMQ